MSLSFYGPFLVSQFVKNAIPCLLKNIFSSLVMYERSNSPLSGLGVKFTTLAAVLKSNSLLLGKGRLSNGGGGGGVGMLMLQIDNCELFYIYFWSRTVRSSAEHKMNNTEYPPPSLPSLSLSLSLLLLLILFFLAIRESSGSLSKLSNQKRLVKEVVAPRE